MKRAALFIAAIVAAFVMCNRTAARSSEPAPSLVAGGGLKLKLVAAGFDRPLYVTSTASEPQRVYLVEHQTGNIVRVDLITGAKEPFFTVPGLSTGFSYGLVSMAFHPAYATNRKFYVSMMTDGNPPTSRIREYAVDLGGTPGSPRDLLIYQQPHRAHNNAWIGFGPDGMLYIGSGDGGDQFGGQLAGGNPSQRLDTLFGKILRIDVDGTDPGLEYRIPDGANGETPNPFVPGGGQPHTDSFGGAARPEIWAFGFRLPWRAGFDRLNGDMYIGDTGDADWEWINFIPADSGGGQNFGWCLEAGTHSVFGVNTQDPNQDKLMAHCVAETSAGDFVDPIHEYPHAPKGGEACVIGGYVYRGCAISGLQGTYFYADERTREIHSFRYDPQSGISEQTNRTAELQTQSPDPPLPEARVRRPSSFGEDAAGELYILSYRDGTLYRIESAAAPPDCDNNSNPDGCDPNADGDGAIDACEACPLEPALLNPSEPLNEVTCADGIDNDCDGLTDTADLDCPIACPNTCGDLDASGGSVTLVDFASFALCFNKGLTANPQCLCADLNADGSTNLADFATFSLLFGTASTSVPPNCP